MREYTTIDQIQNYLLTTIDEDFVYQVTDWIKQMSKYIENQTGRVFTQEDAVERLYDGNGTNSIVIDEFTEITKLEIGGTEISSDDYYVYPANSINKDRIVLKYNIFSSFDPCRQNISVTAKWGYSVTAPEDIVTACTILVAGMIYNSWEQQGEVKSMTMGRYSVSYKDSKGWNDYNQAMEIIKSYKLFKF